MKKILFFIIVLVLGFIFLNNFKSKPQKPLPTYQTQENSEGEVAVSVTPISLSEKENVRFKVSFNTHSVELNYDLKNLAVLTDNNNVEYKPLSWDGGVGGHHLEGNLIFPPLSKKVKEVKLIIKEISGVDRVFKIYLV